MSDQKVDKLAGTSTAYLDAFSITVASPESIRAWSHGEVKNPETINFRTFKPEKAGIFCERIFGPTRDYECGCGKYKRFKHSGIVCDRCGVEVVPASVRRRRMGHIELAAPISHVWFHKGIASRIGLMLDLTTTELERVIYYDDFLVIDPGNTSLEAGQLLNETEFREAEEQYGDGFTAGMGAEALQELLKRIDLGELVKDLQEQMARTGNKNIISKLSRRLKIARGFVKSRTRPEWMILDVLPVLPAGLRPIVQLEEGRYATADLNDHYRRVVNRNTRVRNLLRLKTPDVIIRNEKRMLQEAVDALFDNGRHGRTVTGAGSRPLKSLTDTLRGDQGRLRQNLLGKRVDFSGVTAIVPGPELTLNQCGLPRKMAFVLFEPFIVRRLKQLGYVHTVRSAKMVIARRELIVWDILDEVSRSNLVVLNRPPSLGRLTFQAFEPKLIDGDAILIHPLVCEALKANFDGDQVVVHVPLSAEAQLEARMMLMAAGNILSVADGKPIIKPAQDVLLGCYCLTLDPRGSEARDNLRCPLFSNTSEVELAIAEGAIHPRSRIRFNNPDFGRETVNGDSLNRVIETTAGRVLFNEGWPENLGFFNGTVDAEKVGDLIRVACESVGHQTTAAILDHLKDIGLREATRMGISLGLEDLVVPEEKQSAIERATVLTDAINKEFLEGSITASVRREKLIDAWRQADEVVSRATVESLEHNHGKSELNILSLLLASGARGNIQKFKQLVGARGLVGKTSGDVLSSIVTSNLRDGLSAAEYFVSATGTRNTLFESAQKMPACAELTRKLVDAAHDLFITEQDCGTVRGIIIRTTGQSGEHCARFRSRLIGRASCGKLENSDTGKVLLERNRLIDEQLAHDVVRAGINEVRVRSVLTCDSRRGCCAKCYGQNLGTARPIDLGEPVGMVAAQSIGSLSSNLPLENSAMRSGTNEVGSIQRLVELFDLREVDGPKEVAEDTETENDYLLPLVALDPVVDSDRSRTSPTSAAAPMTLTRQLQTSGATACGELLLEQIQNNFWSHRLEINDKHIEVIIRQMMRKVKVIDPGDTTFLPSEEVDYGAFNQENLRIVGLGGMPAEGERTLCGITRVGLSTDSFLSAASTRFTANVLADAATSGRIDRLAGLKENVILAQLIPAGTGFKLYRDLELRAAHLEEAPLPEEPPPSVAPPRPRPAPVPRVPRAFKPPDPLDPFAGASFFSFGN
jgi:DNA-directed RNA polymerase subunit beta'